MHARNRIELDSEAFVEGLIATFTEWGHAEPLDDARYCAEVLLGSAGEDLPQVRGMAWVDYWTFRVGAWAAGSVVRCLWPDESSDRSIRALELELRADPGRVHQAVRRWAGNGLVDQIGAAAADEMVAEVLDAIDDALKIWPPV